MAAGVAWSRFKNQGLILSVVMQKTWITSSFISKHSIKELKLLNKEKKNPAT